MMKRLMLAVIASLVVGAPVPALAQEPSASPDVPGADASVVMSPAPVDALRGTWDYQLTDEEVEFLAELFGQEADLVGIPGRSTSIRLGFEDDTWWQGFVFDGELWLLDGVPEGAGGRIAYEGDELTLTPPVDLGKNTPYEKYRWSLEGDVLALTLLECSVSSGTGECPDTDIVRFVMEHTYTFSGSDPSY